MAITQSHKFTAGNTSDLTSYTTASLTAVANRLYLMWVYTIASASPNVPTATGGGLTWVAVANVKDAGNRRITLFRAMSASPGAAATIVIDFAGQTQQGCEWSVVEYTGMDTSGTNGSGAIVQSATNIGASGTSLSVTLAAFSSVNNATVGGFGVPLNLASTPAVGSGFTLSGQINQASTNMALMSEFKATNDTGVDCSWVGSVTSAGIAAEIKEAVVATGPKLYTLLDNFNDNIRDPLLWNDYGTGVAEANSRLELTLPISTTGYKGRTSVRTDYDGTESAARIMVGSAGNQALASLEVTPIALIRDTNNSVFFLIAGGNIRAYKRVAGVNTSLASASYVAKTHRFLQLRQTGATTYWEYSATGIEGSYSVLHSVANPITMTALTVQIEAGTYASEASATSVWFDEFNTVYLGTGYKAPGVAYTEDVAGVTGSIIWSDPDNVLLNDGVRASGNDIAVMETGIVREARVMIDGTIDTTNLAADESITGTNMIYGGASDLWGVALDAYIIENVDFGVAIAFGKNVSGTKTTETNFLVTRDYDFDIPYDANVSGYQANFETVQTNLGGGITDQGIDYIQSQIYFQWSPRIEGGGESTGSVWTERLNFFKRDKMLRHRVYTKDGGFVGEWTDLAIEPKFKQQINTPLVTMDLELARTNKTGSRSVEAVMTESDELLLTETDESILADTAAASGLGAGTDLDLNLDYRLTAYYGEFIELLTEDGEPIMTEDDHIVMVEDGAPSGRDLLTGYIEEWDDDIGGRETLVAHILSHSHELNNIMLETADTVVIDNSVASEYDGIAGAGPTDNVGYGQSFTMVGTEELGRISIPMERWGSEFVDLYPKVTMTLRAGTPTSPGAVIAVTDQYIFSRDGEDVSFVFPDYPVLTNSTVYSFELTCDQYKTGGLPTYPVTFPVGSGYSGGDGYKYVSGGWSLSGKDIVFKLWKAGGNTTVPFLSQDPAQMRRSILDFAKTRGARVTYDAESLEDTGAIASYTFKSNTVAEALAKTLELAPADFYSWYDVGQNIDHFHPRPTEVDKTLTIGKDILGLKLKRTMRYIVNDAWFSGGGTPALFKRTQDTASQSQWRRGLSKQSDNRVTNANTAVTMNEGKIERYKDPIYNGSGSIISQVSYEQNEIDGNTYLEDYLLGMLLGFNGSGSYLDLLNLQLVGYTYSPDILDIEIGTLLPAVSKRIEDIRRNLDTLEQQNNPDTPT